ncbi:MAG: hypothetical protein HQL91_00970 [Magnetococcales bacterium]|nr:hypothetical protein [Magnetococcales bacterium]
MNDRTATLDVVVFSVGACRIGIEAARVRACRFATPLDAETTIPMLESFPELHHSPAPAWMVLELVHADLALQWRIPGPVALQTLPAHLIHPLPPLLIARSRLPGLRALAFPESGPARMVLLIEPFRRAAPAASTAPPLEPERNQ